jgi:arsenite oxidase small subunit
VADSVQPEGPGGGRGITRKQALIGGGAVVAAGGAAAIIAVATGGEDEAKAAGYPRAKVAKVAALKPNTPVNFEYPLKGQPSVLIDMGEAVPGGVGDNKSIVAYSVLCQHMGCPVGYQADKKHFLCGCHQSEYDPAREGYVIQGVAQRPLPRIALEISSGDVVATGVDGLIYGYRDNLAPGRKVA